FVIDAMRKTVSGVMAAVPSSARRPKAPWYNTPLWVAALPTPPGPSFASTACFSRPSVGGPRPTGAPAPIQCQDVAAASTIEGNRRNEPLPDVAGSVTNGPQPCAIDSTLACSELYAKSA